MNFLLLGSLFRLRENGHSLLEGLDEVLEFVYYCELLLNALALAQDTGLCFHDDRIMVHRLKIDLSESSPGEGHL